MTGSEALTYGEVAGVMTAELGRPIRYRQPGLLAYSLRAGRDLRLAPAMVATTSAVDTTPAPDRCRSSRLRPAGEQSQVLPQL